MIVLGTDFFERKEDAHAAAAALRDRMLAELCGIVSPQIRVAHGGKPCLAEREDVFFSVSHTGHLAVCVLSFPGTGEVAADYRVLSEADAAPEVGADAEAVQPVENAPRLCRLADRFFPPEIAAQIRNLPKEAVPRAFCEHWTACESYVKMTGEGFGSGFSSLSFAGIALPLVELRRGEERYIIRAAWRTSTLDSGAGL